MAVAGLGPEPYTETGGRVYITGPYRGAPFGLEIVTPAIAGPFNLGTVTARSRLLIDPSDATVTIVSDPLPTQLRGIPLQLKRILVNVDRPSFEFNPTSCETKQIDAAITGDHGATADASVPFKVGGCEHLPFPTRFSASTQAKTSKASGASLAVDVVDTPGQSNVAKVRVTLPATLPARLSTIQKACLAATFAANPASCPEGSNIGTATAHTPVLKSHLLSGPAYLVSHGNAAFPDVEFVLQGEGITLILDGSVAIRKGVTTSSFNSLPDAPLSSFETVLPEGPHSALTTALPASAKYNLCGQKLIMPTVLTGQNGAVIKQNTKIAVEGCRKVQAIKTKASRVQLLAKAIKACRKQHERSRAKRAACERHAHKTYGVPRARRNKRKTAS